MNSGKFGGRRHAQHVAEKRAEQTAEQETRDHLERGDAGVRHQGAHREHAQELVEHHG